MDYTEPLDFENELSVWQQIFVLTEDSLKRYKNSLESDLKKLQNEVVSES